jgi:hypothetical protein
MTLPVFIDASGDAELWWPLGIACAAPFTKDFALGETLVAAGLAILPFGAAMADDFDFAEGGLSAWGAAALGAGLAGAFAIFFVVASRALLDFGSFVADSDGDFELPGFTFDGGGVACLLLGELCFTLFWADLAGAERVRGRLVAVLARAADPGARRTADGLALSAAGDGRRVTLTIASPPLRAASVQVPAGSARNEALFKCLRLQVKTVARRRATFCQVTLLRAEMVGL